MPIYDYEFPDGFSPMRSANYAPSRMRGSYVVSVKLDGVRGCIGSTVVLSKSKKLLANKDLQAKFSRPELKGFDGEFLVGPPTAPDVYNKTFSATSTIKAPFEGKFYVFDDFTVAGFTAAARKARILRRVEELPQELRDLVEVAPFHRITIHPTDYSESEAAYEAALAQGYEGLVYIQATSSYRFGKCSEAMNIQYKRKPEDDHDAQILDVECAYENTNPTFVNELGHSARSTHQENLVPKEMVGRFRVRDVHTGQEFWCGPGKMTHVERISTWRAFCLNRMNVVGRFIKYRSMSYGTIDLPRQPRWYAWRDAADTDTPVATVVAP